MFKRYLAGLSSTQWRWAIAGLLIAVVLVLLGFVLTGDDAAPDVSSFTTAMTLKDAAMALDSTGSAVAKELGLSIDAPKTLPLADLGVADADLQETAEHLLGHRDTTVKYWLYAALVVWAWVFMTRIGRPRGKDGKGTKPVLWYPRVIYLATLLIALGVAGFALGKSPNPMEGAVKVFKAMVGLYPDTMAKVYALLFFLGLAVIGNKLICGWACPLGALQELVYSIPWLRKLKRRAKPSFLVLNLLRLGLFVVVMLVLFGVIGDARGMVIYHFGNAFNVFNLDFAYWTVTLVLAATVLIGFVVYRPFCHVICPFGLLSWVVERISFYRVRVDHSRCDVCGACGRACPTSAANDIVERMTLKADCFSCARCLTVCPTDAIRFESVFTKHDKPESDVAEEQATQP